MNKLSPMNEWQCVKSEICDSLYKNKCKRTLQILAEKYAAADVVCLQEVAAVFVHAFHKSPLHETHTLVTPSKIDGKRDQNSVVVLLNASFDPASARELTALEVVRRSEGAPCFIVSYHGDTNGLMTLPM